MAPAAADVLPPLATTQQAAAGRGGGGGDDAEAPPPRSSSSAVAAASAPPAALPWRTAAANVALLGLGWAFAASGLFVQVSTTSLAVNALRPGTPLATVPLALFFVAAASSLVPLSLLARRTGRAPVFLAATALAVFGAALQLGAAYVAAAAAAGSGGTAPALAMLSVGAALQGVSFSTANNYRFVGGEFVDDPSLRPRAMSLVVCCAILAAPLGPEVSRLVVGLVPGVPYAGAYAYLMALYGAQICCLLLVDWRALAVKQREHAEAAAAAEERRRRDEAKRPLNADAAASSPAPPAPVVSRGTPYRELLLTRDFVTASACCAGAFASMAALMALTPLRIVGRGLGAELAAHSVVSHIAAMYLPCAVMGDLVRVLKVAPCLVGGFLTLMAGTVALFGDGRGGGGGSSSASVPSPAAFYAGMVLIGAGWSAAYVAASSLALSCYASEPPPRRFPIQATTDTCVLLLSGLAMGSATPLLRAEGFGWAGVVALYAAVNGAMAVLGVWWGVQRWVGARRRGEG